MPFVARPSTNSNNNNNNNKAAAAPSNINNNNNNNSNSTNSAAPNLHPCKRVYKNGCYFGDKCKFARYPVNACFDELKNGRCSKGSGCRFVHGAKPVSLAADSPNSNDGDTKNEDDDSGASFTSVPDSDTLFPSLDETPAVLTHEETKATNTNNNKKSKPAPAATATAGAAASNNSNKKVEDTKTATATATTAPPPRSTRPPTVIPAGMKYELLVSKNNSNGIAALLRDLRQVISCYKTSKADLAQSKIDKKEAEANAEINEAEFKAKLRKEHENKLARMKSKNFDMEREVIELEKNTTAVERECNKRAFLLKNLIRDIENKKKNNNNKSNDDDDNTNSEEDKEKAAALYYKSKLAKAEENINLARTFFKVISIARSEVSKQNTDGRHDGLETLRINECMLAGDFEGSVVNKFFKAVPKSANFFSKCSKKDEYNNNNNSSLDLANFRIVFHGTRGESKAARAIECGGLHPGYRSGQAYGRGEYCSPRLDVASGYSNSAILVFLIYTKSGVAPVSFHNGDDIIVVDNPTCYSKTFMLPLGTLYGSSVDVAERSCVCDSKKAF